MRSMSQCFNIVYLAVGFTAGQLTVLNGRTACALGYPFTPNGPRRLLLCRFLDAGMTNPSTPCGGGRPKNAKARRRRRGGTGGGRGGMGGGVVARGGGGVGIRRRGWRR